MLTNTQFIRRISFPCTHGLMRQLVGDDFWDGLGAPFGGAEITVTVELTGFHTDPKAKALLSHCVISQEPLVARLTYCYRPRAGVAPADALSQADYDAFLYGGSRGSASIAAGSKSIASNTCTDARALRAGTAC
jgi:putative ATP-dependent endonuclease of OLD family